MVIHSRRTKATAKRCMQCGRHFEGEGRARYCCNACRQAGYRDRKRGAGNIDQEGGR
jgi:hypothetical protein